MKDRGYSKRKGEENGGEKDRRGEAGSDCLKNRGKKFSAQALRRRAGGGSNPRGRQKAAHGR